MTTDREGGGITSKHSPPIQVQTRERKEKELLTTTTTMIETGTGTGFVVDAKKPECDDNTIKKLYNRIFSSMFFVDGKKDLIRIQHT